MLDILREYQQILIQLKEEVGRGIQAMSTKEDDFVEHVIVTSTHSDVLFFTNKGRVYKLRAYEIPDAGRTAKGN